MKIKVKSVLEAFCEYFIVLSVIFSNYCMITRDQKYGISENVFYVFLIVVFLLFVIIQLLAGRHTISNGAFICVLMVTVVSLLTVVVPGVNLVLGLIKWCGLFFACSLYFAFNQEKSRFWKRYVDVITVLAFVSLVLYFVGSVLQIIQPSRVARFLYDGKYLSCNTYFGLLYESQRAQELLTEAMKYRNCGIFIEAPMYNIMLCFAFCAELAFNKAIRKSVAVILAVTIITTQTTTGTLFLILMLGIWLYSKGKQRFIKILKLVSLPVLLMIAIILVNMIVESKQQTIDGAASMSIRSDHMWAFLKMFAAKPLFGHGYMSSALFEYTTYDQGYSVGLPALLGRCGGLMFLLYLVSWIRQTMAALTNDFQQMYFWLGSFVLLLFTAVVYQPIMIIVICFQLQYSPIQPCGKGRVSIKGKV